MFSSTALLCNSNKVTDVSTRSLLFNYPVLPFVLQTIGVVSNINHQENLDVTSSMSRVLPLFCRSVAL